MIKTWEQRCEEHPDHQMGMVSHGMIQARMQEEIDDLRAALAQPEQEPVAWWDGKESVVFVHDEIYTPNWTDYWTRPLYTHPPQRKPLTQEEILSVFDSHNVYGSKWVEFARAIERAHGIGEKT